MTSKSMGILCVAVSVVLTLTGGAFAQSSTSSTGGLTNDQLNQIISALGGTGALSSLLSGSSGSSALSGLLGGTTGTTTGATSQPSLDSRVGPPATMINAAIAEHTQFNNVAFNMTPTAQRSALGITLPTAPVKIPIINLFKALVDVGAKYIPALQGLATLLDRIMPNNPTSNATPPTPVTDKGLVAYVTADDTSLTVGQTTTGHLWVQQTSPNTAKDNGVFSVAVNVEAAPAGTVQCLVPVTFISPWDKPILPALTGTAVSSTGGISGIVTGEGGLPPNKSRGTSGPSLVADFEIRAKAAGTVKLTPTNFNEQGYTGITAFGSDTPGDESNYVPVEITVQ